MSGIKTILVPDQRSWKERYFDLEEMNRKLSDSVISGALKLQAEIQSLRERAEKAEAILKLVDDDVRCHLRDGSVGPALLRRHAVAAVREYLTERAALPLPPPPEESKP